MFGKKVGVFEGVAVYESPIFGSGRHSGGLALPGFGIFVGTGTFSDKYGSETVIHEFGHFLQARQTGFLMFYIFIGIPSLMSAWLNWHGRKHKFYWTEMWCNYLVDEYFQLSDSFADRFPIKDISPRTKYWLVKN